MKVIFDRIGIGTDYLMLCFHNCQTKQADMMHRLDIDKQVEEWQKGNSGNPPKFYSRIKIKRFTNEILNARIDKNKTVTI